MIVGSIRAIACIGALNLGGCTIVRVNSPAGVTTRAHLGVLEIRPLAPGTIVYRSTGIGLVPGRHGATFGLASETAALVYASDACRIILFAPRRRDVAMLADTLAPVVRRGDICSTGEE